MIRILQIVSSMDRGGLETFIMNVYRNIDREKIQFDFLVHTKRLCAYDQEIKELGGNIYQVCSRRENYFKNIRELNTFFKEHNEYDIVHMHESSLSYITPLKIAKKYNISTRVLHSRNNNITGNKIHLLFHYYHKLFYKKYVTDCFAISTAAAIWMFGKKQYYKKQVALIKNGIETNDFIFNSRNREIIRTKLGIKKNDILIGHVGRFSPQKNHEFLIDIFISLKKNKNYKLLLIGDGKTKVEIIKRVRKEKIEKKVIILENTNDIYMYYSAMDIFVMPSLFEGLGRVLIEAQCNGLVCFASKDVIAQEVKILPTFNFISLNDLNNWLFSIENSDYKRIENAQHLVKRQGFDISNTVAVLTNFYIENVEK